MYNILKNAISWLRWYRKEIIFGAIIVTVASLSFGLGYRANRTFSHTPIIIEKCSNPGF